MAYTKTTWVNNSSPYINADNLNKIENQLETNTSDIETNSTNIQTNTTKLDTITSYSTTEQVVGTWTDNKPLYRKVIYVSSLPDTTALNVPLNISNLNEIISINGIASNGNLYFVLPSYRADPVAGIEMYVNTNVGIVIGTGQDRTSFYANIILEYTKTTD